MADKYAAYLSLLGRILLGYLFVTSGFGKLSNLGGTAGSIASSGLPAPMALAVLVGLLEFVGGLVLVVGFQVRWMGLALGLFTLVASVIFHAYWSAPEALQAVAKLLFTKNLSVAGGMFVISALGAGPLSLDGRRSAR